MMVIDEDAAMFSGYGDGSSDQFSQQRWQDKTAAVADDYIKLKYQLETAMRDKERDANTISSLKHVRENNFHRITFVVQDNFPILITESLSPYDFLGGWRYRRQNGSCCSRAQRD